MKSDDLTLQVLIEIRDQGKQTNEELARVRTDLGERIDETNKRIDETRDEMIKRTGESEVRLATSITDMVGTLHDIRDAMKTRRDLDDRVARCEDEIAELKRRLG